MIRELISRRIDAEERRAGVPLEYVRYILRTSVRSFLKYALFLPMSKHRHRLPAEAFHTARLVATQREDCGTCVQIVVNLARSDGLSAALIEAVLAGRTEAMSAELADVHRFTTAVLQATYDEGPLRERLRSRYGDEGLIELAFAIAAVRVFPITKRALGYAVSCAKVDVRV
jgi:alkylhydroperoxidase family enzyme